MNCPWDPDDRKKRPTPIGKQLWTMALRPGYTENSSNTVSGEYSLCVCPPGGHLQPSPPTREAADSGQNRPLRGRVWAVSDPWPPPQKGA